MGASEIPGESMLDMELDFKRLTARIFSMCGRNLEMRNEKAQFIVIIHKSLSWKLY